MSQSPTSPIPTTLWAQFRRHWPRWGLGLLLIAVYQTSQYWFDTQLMQAINAATSGDRLRAIRLGVLLIALAVAALGVRVASRIAVFNGGRIAEYELRSALFDRLQRLGPSFYRRMSTGEIMSRVTNDLLQVRMLLGFVVLNVINTAFGLVSALSVTLTISPKLTLAALTPLPLLVLVTVRFSREMFTRTRDNQAAIGKLSEQVQSSIAGVRVVRAFGLESQQLEQFERSNQLYLEKSLSLARLRGLLFPLMQAIISIGILVVFWYGGHLILVGDLTTGGFLAFYRALARLTWPLIALGFLMGMLQRGRAAYARLAEIYTAEPDVVDGPLPAPARIEGRLEIKNLTFAHDNVPALSGVTLTLERGQSLAIVGRIASGKSTLAALLARLLPTPRGSVFLDGTDICDLPLSTVRSAIGYVQQTAFLFSTTAGRNIGFSLDQPDAGPSLLTIREAARQARILDELLALPDGLDTVVGERGVQLSGGQRQRVSLARAFVSDPKILVLDDPLSSVDADTEKGILAAIEHQSAVRGLILITHRVSAASRCDQILVLDRGKVVERGSHGELLAKGGLYARFAEEQRIERELEALGDGEPNTVAVALA